MIPFRSLLMIASSEEAMIAARKFVAAPVRVLVLPDSPPEICASVKAHCSRKRGIGVEEHISFRTRCSSREIGFRHLGRHFAAIRCSYLQSQPALPYGIKKHRGCDHEQERSRGIVR